MSKKWGQAIQKNTLTVIITELFVRKCVEIISSDSNENGPCQDLVQS